MTKKLTTARDLHEEWMQDSEYVAAWEASEEEFALANAPIEATRGAETNTLKVGIATAEEMKARTLAIARGELKPHADDPKVWFTSPESFAKVLSNKNRSLLDVIASTRPESLQDLATATGRKTSNLSRTLRTMEQYGFVRLHRGVRGRIRPEVPYQSIALEMALAQ